MDLKTAPVALGGSIPAATSPSDAPSVEFLNRDASWLEFNRRVLHKALDDRTPLLERVRFLGIFTSNLDEFFMKRVGGLKRQIASGAATDGVAPAEALGLIRRMVLPMLAQQADCYTRVIKPKLAENGIELLEWIELT